MARLSPQSVKRCSRAVIRVTQTSIFFRNDGSNLFEKVKVLKKNVLQTAIQFHVIRKTRLFSLTRLQMKIQHVRTLILERYSDNCRPDLNHCWVVDVLGLEALVFLHLLRKRWFFFYSTTASLFLLSSWKTRIANTYLLTCFLMLFAFAQGIHVPWRHSLFVQFGCKDAVHDFWLHVWLK